MNYMFGYCRTLANFVFSNFDTASVEDMAYMFAYVGSTTSESLNGIVDLDLSYFDTGSVTNMNYMFYNAYKFKSIDLSTFDTSAVNTMYGMFYYTSYVKELDLSNFVLSNSASLSQMLYYNMSLNKIVFSQDNYTRLTADGVFDNYNSPQKYINNNGVLQAI